MVVPCHCAPRWKNTECWERLRDWCLFSSVETGCVSFLRRSYGELFEGSSPLTAQRCSPSVSASKDSCMAAGITERGHCCWLVFTSHTHPLTPSAPWAQAPDSLCHSLHQHAQLPWGQHASHYINKAALGASFAPMSASHVTVH